MAIFLTIEIETNSITVNNSQGRKMLSYLIVGIVLYAVYSLKLYSDPNIVTDLISKFETDSRFPLIFLLLLFCAIYLWRTDPVITRFDGNGIHCYRFHGEKDVNFKWSQVDYVDHDRNNITFHFDFTDQVLKLTPLDVMLANNRSYAPNLFFELYKLSQFYLKPSPQM